MHRIVFLTTGNIAVLLPAFAIQRKRPSLRLEAGIMDDDTEQRVHDLENAQSSLQDQVNSTPMEEITANYITDFVCDQPSSAIESLLWPVLSTTRVPMGLAK